MGDELYVSPSGTLGIGFHWNKKKEVFTSMTITDRGTGEVKSRLEASSPAIEKIIRNQRDRLFVNYDWRRDEQPV